MLMDGVTVFSIMICAVHAAGPVRIVSSHLKQ